MDHNASRICMYNIMYHNSINVPLRQVYMVVVCGRMMSTFKHCNWWHVSIKCLANISCISKSFLKGSSSSRLNYAYSMTIEQVGYIHTYIYYYKAAESQCGKLLVRPKEAASFAYLYSRTRRIRRGEDDHLLTLSWIT